MASADNSHEFLKKLSVRAIFYAKLNIYDLTIIGLRGQIRKALDNHVAISHISDVVNSWIL